MTWGLVASPLVMLGLTPWLPKNPLWTSVVVGSVLAVVSAWVSHRFAGDPAMAAWWWLGIVGVVLGWIDVLHHRLPHPWLAVLLTGGLAVFASVALREHRLELVARLLVASVVVLVLGLLVQWVAPGQVGFGDTLLLAGLAPYWAWHGWPTVLEGLISSHLVLGVLAGMAWLAGLRGPEARIAAGPGLLLGAWLPLL